LDQKVDDSLAKPLISILSQYIQKQDIKPDIKIEPMGKDCLCSFNPKSLRNSELIGLRCNFLEVVKDEGTDALTDALNKLMLESGPLTGHLVDKLVRLEPEILGSSVDLQVYPFIY
jgi:hypothetical protein